MPSRLQPVDDGEAAQNFTLIGSEAPPPYQSPKIASFKDSAQNALSGLILTALKTLSQRSLVAISNLFSLILAGSAFALWWRALPNPTTPQLIGLGMFAGFILALDFVRRR